MKYDVDKLNKLFRTMTARKISVISRLADLSTEEISIMKMRWLNNMSDIQICDHLNISTATLTRKRRHAYCKVADALDLYGLLDNESIEVQELLDYNGLFYKAQDELIRYFLKHKSIDEQNEIIEILKDMNTSESA